MKKILHGIYRTRYSTKEEKIKEDIWKVLCEEYLQKFINKNDIVLDIAAGHCEFINHIICKKKYALDIDPRIKQYVKTDVKIFTRSATALPRTLTNSINVVFIGCLLEHLPSKNAIIKVFREVKRVLKNKGRLLILNPNIRFSTSEYWDYFDHLTPVSDRSIVEILQALGYTIDLCIPRFVPNTIKDRLPKFPFLVRLYLHLPFLFPLFGRQMFIVARKAV